MCSSVNLTTPLCPPRHHASRLEEPPEGNLCIICQGDLENAFHMLRGSPGLSDYFVMSPIQARALGICERHGKLIDPNS